MTSGNFIIGDDLSLEGFNHYIKPNLEKYQAKVIDFMIFNGRLNSGSSNKHLLVSLIGKNESLDEVVKKSMKEAYPFIEKDQREIEFRNMTAQIYQIKYFETLGLYQDDKTASKVYQNLAIKYSSIDAKNELSGFEEKISYFTKRFK